MGADVFSALADPTRREVVRILAERGHVTATELAAELPVSRQAIAKHLGLLRDAGLATVERDGREAIYRFDADPLADAMGWMAATGAKWDRRLARLERGLR